MYTTAAYAIRAMSAGSGTGYLLKDRVADADTLVHACARSLPAARWSTARSSRCWSPAGLANAARLAVGTRARRADPDGRGPVEPGHRIRLHLSLRTVETHIGHIMAKLDVEDSAEGHRRVLAVLRYLGRGA